MTREFEDKHVVVTGGTGALGRAVIAALLDRGAVCHVPTYGDGKGFEHAERVELATSVDLTDEASASSFFAELPPLWASIHVAGGFAFMPILETALADFEKMHRINALTCFLSCREAVRALRRKGGTEGGRIVNVAARPAVAGAANLVAYGASKAAVANMTEALAAELVGEGILVNAVLPSLIDTPPNREAMPDADFGAWPKPAEIAEAICFLASPRNRTTSGALLPVYGRS